MKRKEIFFLNTEKIGLKRKKKKKKQGIPEHCCFECFIMFGWISCNRMCH